MKKIWKLLLIVFCAFMLTSCDNITQDPNEDLNDKYANYEKPQTGFIKDGHTLSNTEEVFKYIIDNGTYVFDYRLDGLGYKLILATDTNTEYVAFYTVDHIKLAKIEIDGRRFYTTYINIYNEESDTFNLVYKRNYESGRYKDFMGILPLNKKNFENDMTTEAELWRGDKDKSSLTDEVIRENMLEAGALLLKYLDEGVLSKISLNLESLGY